MTCQLGRFKSFKVQPRIKWAWSARACTMIPTGMLNVSYQHYSIQVEFQSHHTSPYSRYLREVSLESWNHQEIELLFAVLLLCQSPHLRRILSHPTTNVQAPTYSVLYVPVSIYPQHSFYTLKALNDIAIANLIKMQYIIAILSERAPQGWFRLGFLIRFSSHTTAARSGVHIHPDRRLACSLPYPSPCLSPYSIHIRALCSSSRVFWAACVRLISNKHHIGVTRHQPQHQCQVRNYILRRLPGLWYCQQRLLAWGCCTEYACR